MERRRAKFAPRRLLFSDNDEETLTEQSNASVPSLNSSSFLQSPSPATPGLSSLSSSFESPQSQFQTPDSSGSSQTHRSICPPTPVRPEKDSSIGPRTELIVDFQTPNRSFARSTPNYRAMKTESPAYQSLIRSVLIPESPEVEMHDLNGRDKINGLLNFPDAPSIMLTPAGVLNSPKKFHATSPRTFRATSAPPTSLNVNLFPGPTTTSSAPSSSVQLKNNVNPFSPDHRHVRSHVTVPMEPNTTMSRYLQDFDEISVLSKGRYSTVCKSFNRVDGCFYAIKKVKYRTVREKECFLQEVYALAAIRDHSHIMRYSTAWIDEEERMIYIQTEFCSGGSLAQFVAATNIFAAGTTYPTTSTPHVHLAAQRRTSNPDENKIGMSEKELCVMINQIAKALDYLHHREMVHFDIKPDNIFISPSTDKATSAGHDDSFAKPHDQPSLLRPCYKLGDLGLISDIRAKSVDYNEGDNKYLSRELLEFEMSTDNWQKRLLLPKSDIFSLGCTAYELARGHALPQSGEEYDAIRRAEISLDTSKFSHEFINLLRWMLDPNPANRPSARDLQLHPLIADNVVDTSSLKARISALEDEIHDLKTKQQQREFKLRRQSFSPAPKNRSRKAIYGEDELEISLSRTLTKYGKELDSELVKTIAHEIRLQMETTRFRSQQQPYSPTQDVNSSYFNRNYVSINESYDGDVDESRCDSSVDAAPSKMRSNSAETIRDVPRIVLTPAMSQ